MLKAKISPRFPALVVALSMCMFTHTHTNPHTCLWGSIPDNQFVSKIFTISELLPLFLSETGQLNSLPGKDETEKKNMTYKYHTMLTLHLICKILLETTLKKSWTKHFNGM